VKLDDATLLPVGVSRAEVVTLRGGVAQSQPDWVADEVPVSLVFNGVSHAVMLATPADLEDFALGFALTEGLLENRAELYGIDVMPVELGIEVHLEVSSACAWRLRDRRRTLAGRTGCGLCGTEQLAQVRRPLPVAPVVQLAVAAMARAQRDLRRHQALQQLTGAAHAAAWCGFDGSVHFVREDIGRHNALDKLVGALVTAGRPAAEGFACITSRASFEMVQKTAAAGIGALAAVSAPTRLAVDTARSLGVALAGFVRGDDAVAYAFPDRFLFPTTTLAADHGH
jgi:FdhD protein